VPADDELELRLKALREELKRDMEGVRHDVDGRLGDIESNIKLLKWLFVAVIGVFSLIAAILTSAANII
jgi:hypothetical protein